MQLSIGWEKGAFILEEVEGEGEGEYGAWGQEGSAGTQAVSAFHPRSRGGAKTPSFQPDKCIHSPHPLQSPTGRGWAGTGVRVLLEGGASRGNVYWSSTAQRGTDTPEGHEVTQPGLQDIGRGRCLVSFNSFASRTIQALGAGYRKGS